MTVADLFTQFEDRMEELYDQRKDAISRIQAVRDWDDVNYRWGYLQAIREIGKIIKELRNPEQPKESGEIPSIVEAENGG